MTSKNERGLHGGAAGAHAMTPTYGLTDEFLDSLVSSDGYMRSRNDLRTRLAPLLAEAAARGRREALDGNRHVFVAKYGPGQLCERCGSHYWSDIHCAQPSPAPAPPPATTRLGQTWVTKVTTADGDAPSVQGAGAIEWPDELVRFALDLAIATLDEEGCNCHPEEPCAWCMCREAATHLDEYAARPSAPPAPTEARLREAWTAWLNRELADAHAEMGKQTTETGQAFYSAEIMCLKRCIAFVRSSAAAPIDAESLRPCPFCGAQAALIELTDEGYGNAGGRVVQCTGCEASTRVWFPAKDSVDRIAREAWNRLPAPAAAPVERPECKPTPECPSRHPVSGDRCVLESGHEAPHRNTPDVRRFWGLPDTERPACDRTDHCECSKCVSVRIVKPAASQLENPDAPPHYFQPKMPEWLINTETDRLCARCNMPRSSQTHTPPPPINGGGDPQEPRRD